MSVTIRYTEFADEPDDPRVRQASRFAIVAHDDVEQTRKYTGEPYHVHCREVAEIVARHGGLWYQQAAAWLHDTVEDTNVTRSDINAVFPDEVAEIVDYMTERQTEGNRATRKAAERDRLARGNGREQAVKLADLVSNSRSIVEHDPHFAKVFLKEFEELLGALTGAPVSIRNEAQRALVEGQERMVQWELAKKDGVKWPRP